MRLLKITSILLSIIAIPAYILLLFTLAAKSGAAATVALVTLLLLFGTTLGLGIKYSKKNGKQYCSTIMLIFAILGIIAATVFRLYIIDFVNEVTQPIGPGALPPSAMN